MSESCDRCSADCKHIDECIGEGIMFERIRRCTGYLSGDYKTRFNDAKQAEVEDRISSNSFRRTEQYHES